ncbi:UNVERIFIED_CONTAM: Brefeldin A-inhibited guanine nucleotide-exchange protein 5 [Sesamum calycinum]|uniref:Brefeldin A-inhibited guanine nucleotide-exchange protein 5 n=1 Tax=Sesamum calycinum TaxID=2727403 RepID=A0AAW2LSW3_9LAMI
MAGRAAGGFVARAFESMLKECSHKKYNALQSAIQTYLDSGKDFNQQSNIGETKQVPSAASNQILNFWNSGSSVSDSGAEKIEMGSDDSARAPSAAEPTKNTGSVTTVLANAGHTLGEAEAELVLNPLRLAFETKNMKVVELALDCLHKLIEYNHLEGDPGLDGYHSSSIESASYCHSIHKDARQIEMILNIVHGELLVGIIKVCYNIALNSKSPINQATSKAMLTQMLSINFRQMETDAVSTNSAEPKEARLEDGSSLMVGAVSSSDHNDLRMISGNVLSMKQIPTEGIQNLAGGTDVKGLEAVLQKAVDLEDGGKATRGTGPECMSLEQRDALLLFHTLMSMKEGNDEFTTKSYSCLDLCRPCGRLGSVFDKTFIQACRVGPRALRPETRAIRPAFGRALRWRCAADALGIVCADAITSARQAVGGRARSIKATELLTRLSVRYRLRLLDKEEINHLLGLLEDVGHLFTKNFQFIDSIRAHLSFAILRASVSQSPALFQHATGILSVLLLRYRESFKAEIGVLFPLIVLKSFDGSDLNQKLSVLRMLEKLCKDPQMLVDFYINYDCDPEAPNLFGRMIATLSKIAQGTQNVDPKSSTASQIGLIKTSSLQGLVNVLKSLVIWEKSHRESKKQNQGKESLEVDDCLRDESNSREDSLSNFEKLKAHKSTIEDVISEAMIGDYLGQNEEFSIAVMHACVESLNFSGMKFDMAFREFLKGFRLPGEAQKIDRIMEKFAERYCADNPGLFKNADTAYVLAYAIIMLNTDAHNLMVSSKMSKNDFIHMITTNVFEESVPQELLEDMYDSIVKKEIEMKDDPAANLEKSKQNPEVAKGVRYVDILNLALPKRSSSTDFKSENEAIIKQIQTLIKAQGGKRGFLYFTED